MKLCIVDVFLRNQHAIYRWQSWETRPGRSMGGQRKWYQGPLSKWWKTRIKNSSLTQKTREPLKVLVTEKLVMITSLQDSPPWFQLTGRDTLLQYPSIFCQFVCDHQNMADGCVPLPRLGFKTYCGVHLFSLFCCLPSSGLTLWEEMSWEALQ